jgi:ribosomal protein L11 methyltransferase
VSRSFVSIRVGVGSAKLADRVAAEAHVAGAAGLEERESELLIYAPADRAGAVLRALRRCTGAAVGEPSPVEDVDWTVAWREGMTVVEISPRLAIRPSFLEHAERAGQATLVIDPGQAFGTGGHASTRLALTLLDGLHLDELANKEVLDIGSGTGVLALAALALGARRAVAHDIDPLAAREIRANADANRLRDRVLVFTGPVAAIGSQCFDVALANMLRSELLPALPGIAARTRPGGVAIFSGLLESEREVMELELVRVGFSVEATRTETDAAGDRWVGLLTRRQPPGASGRASARGSR